MNVLGIISFLTLVITSMAILVFRDWRISTAALGSQYLPAFYLVTRSWPTGMAVVILILGWMTTAAIALTCLRQLPPPQTTEPTTELLFRGVAGILVIMVIFILSPGLTEDIFPNINIQIIQGGLMLMGMALMQLGTNTFPHLTIISLLSFLLGFKIIHSALEQSTLLTGLLVIVNLGLALVGVYFITQSTDPQELEE
jgi:nitric oxide reductase large subunit